MSKRVEKTIQHSPPYLKQYRELCSRHPWYSEATEMRLDWKEKVAEIRAMPGDFEENIKILYKHSRPITIEDDIAYAKAVLAHQDIFEVFAAQAKKNHEKQADYRGPSDLVPNYVDLTSAFQDWYFTKQGLPTYLPGETMLPARAIIQKFVLGELPSVDGPDAWAYAISLGVRKQTSTAEKK